MYGADGVEIAPAAAKRLARLEELGYGHLPICMAKTQYSLSHDASRLGRPTGFRVPVKAVTLAAGAGFVTNSSLTASSTLTLGDANNATFGGSIVYNAVASGGFATLRLTKVGAGKLTLTGHNSNVGQTSVVAEIGRAHV